MGPSVYLASLFSVIIGSESVSYERILDGNSTNCHFHLLELDPTFKSALDLEGDVLNGWKLRYQDALEKFVALAMD